LAISKEKRQQLMADYLEKLERSRGIILTNYQGQNVTRINQLRNQLRPTGTGYHVVKNTLFRLALQEAKLPELEALLEGPTAIGFCYQDMQTGARALLDQARVTGAFSVKGGLIGRRMLTLRDIERLASLPPREAVVAQMLHSLRAPLGRLVTVLKGPTRGLLMVLKARTDQLASAQG